MQIQPFSHWKSQRPLVIAGPCSAETEEQLLTTCRQIASLGGVDMLRAGIWKPRTRPNSFEGVGEIGLSWLLKAKKELGLPTTTEVASAQHVELALKYEIDVVWLGARTTVNPFTVQEIANALQGTKIPVMIKNPVNPELSLWIGAIERIYNAGITQIAAIHRGFSTLEKSSYRNAPMWQIPIELKRQYPTLPLFCDPSHIGGARDLISPITQKALDLNYDGMIVETHHNPKEAWSDAAQQLTPQALKEMLENLHWRNATVYDAVQASMLEMLRKEIDAIDREIVENLAARMALVHKIGDYKKENNIAVFQPDRWQYVFQTRADWAEKMNLHINFIKHIFMQVHEESIRLQSQIASPNAPIEKVKEIKNW